MLRKQRCTDRGRKATDVWALESCSESASRPITRGAQQACKVTCQIVEGSASDVGGWSADDATRPIHADHITSPWQPQAHPGRLGRILSDTGQLTPTTSTTMGDSPCRACTVMAACRFPVRPSLRSPLIFIRDHVRAHYVVVLTSRADGSQRSVKISPSRPWLCCSRLQLPGCARDLGQAPGSVCCKVARPGGFSLVTANHFTAPGKLQTSTTTVKGTVDLQGCLYLPSCQTVFTGSADFWSGMDECLPGVCPVSREVNVLLTRCSEASPQVPGSCRMPARPTTLLLLPGEGCWT